MSPITPFTLSLMFEISKIHGLVGGSKEYPVTCATELTIILQSQEPLNPVCPVTNTFFFIKL